MISGGSGRRRRSPMPRAPAGIDGDVFDSESARVRLGYAIDNILLYGTGGIAWSSNQYIRTQLADSVNNAARRARRGRQPISHRMDGGRRHSRRLRQKLECVRGISPYELWLIQLLLPLSQIVTNSKTDLERDRIRRELQIRFDQTCEHRFHCRSRLREIEAGAALQGAAARPRDRDGLDGRLRRHRRRLWLGEIERRADECIGEPLDPYEFGPRRPFAGVLVGGNYQFNHFVVGVEADWQWGNLTNNSQANSSSSRPMLQCLPAPSPAAPSRFPPP